MQMARVDLAHLAAHPIVYSMLILPFGAVSGYLTVALAYSLTQSGMSVADVSLLIALYLAPQTWKFLWAPVVDTTLTRKSWYVIGATLSALSVVAMAAFSAHTSDLAVLCVFVVLASVAVTFLGMSVESLMAFDTSESQKGRAAGWFQAGNLGGGGIGGGAALWLSQHIATPWVTGAALGASFALCCIGLRFVPEPRIAHRREGIGRKLNEVAKDLWRMARSRTGYLALLVVFLPIGTGAASNLWAAVADYWHASAQSVALINGALGGMVSALGCVVGGYLCDRFNRKFAYIGFGLILALVAVGMALSARTQLAYIAFTVAYAFGNGLCYAAFSAVTLEAIGVGAAATKYNLMASLSNMPIAYMTAVEGWASTRWGGTGFLYLEAALSVASLMVFTAAYMFSARRTVPASAGA
jgi:MFS transporter, PAT family, beta-lactamase induction signal transducer AmpG